MKLFTTANSISERNTKTEQLDIQTSIALTYDTGGRLCWLWVFCVANVNSDVTPNVTRAGIASYNKTNLHQIPAAVAGLTGLIQKLIHDITTISALGM